MQTSLAENTRVRCVQILPTTALCRTNIHTHTYYHSVGAIVVTYDYYSCTKHYWGVVGREKIIIFRPLKFKPQRGVSWTRVRRHSEHSRPRIVVSRLPTRHFENNLNNKTLYYENARSRGRRKVRTCTPSTHLIIFYSFQLT